MRTALVVAAVAIAVGIFGCSSDDSTSSSSSSSSSSGESSTSSSGGTECREISECPLLTCTCGGLAGASVQKCTNGVCAKSCVEAGCS